MTKQEIIYDEINYNITQYKEYYNNELIALKLFDQKENVTLNLNFKTNTLVRNVSFDVTTILHNMKAYNTFTYTIIILTNLNIFRIVVNDKYNTINLNKAILNHNDLCTQLCTLSDHHLVHKLNKMLNIDENIFVENSYTLSEENHMKDIIANFKIPEYNDNFVNHFNDF